MSAAEDAIKILNQQWYNTITSGLGLSQNQFQLTQGGISLGNDSQTIWDYLDSIPPVSVTNYFDPAGHNSFAQAYGAVINNLIPQNADDLKTLLKDKYASWVTYNSDPKNNPSPLPKQPDGSLDYTAIAIEKFQTWGISNVDKSVIEAGTTVLKQQDIITVAINMWTTADTKYAYTATQGSLSDALAKGIAKSAEMNSKTTSSDTSHSWARGSASGMFRFFSAGGSASWDKFTQDISSQGIDIQVSFKKVCTLPGKPYMTKSGLNPDLMDFNPWFNSAALKTAKENNNNNVWKHTAPHWEDVFGPKGNLLRLNAGLIVVDGINVTMKSTASVSKDRQENFRSAASAGFWPFFRAEGSGGWSNHFTFNDDGSFTVTSESKEGNPTVIGVLVDSIETVLG